MCQVGSTAFILRSRDRDDLHPFALTVFLVDGDGELQQIQAIVSSPDDGEVNHTLQVMYAAIKRSVLGVDEVVEQVFADLDSLDVLDDSPPLEDE